MRGIQLAVAQFMSPLDRHFSLLHTTFVAEEQMATLNIKKIPDRLYRKIQARAVKRHRSVTQEVIHILSEATAETKPLSILKLQGLGKNIWRDIDTSKHINKERRGWD